MASSRRQGPPPPARLRRVRLLILDVDGVLTDGGLYYGPDGEEWKRFHVHDGLALARAAAAGFPVAVLSSRTSPAVARRCAELGLTEVHQGVGDKLAVYEAVRARRACRPCGAMPGASRKSCKICWTTRCSTPRREGTSPSAPQLKITKSISL